MIASQVRDILVPLEQFPHLPQTATVREAYDLLHRQHSSGGWRFRHMLVFNDSGKVVGVLSLVDLLRTLMPDYIRASLSQKAYGGPMAADASLSLLWQESFSAQCRQLAGIPVASHMTPVQHTVRTDDPITLAAYLMIAHHVHMLPALEDGVVAGVVRIVDVFNQAALEVLRG
jgi:CBS-domain-containing membrane protein